MQRRLLAVSDTQQIYSTEQIRAELKKYGAYRDFEDRWEAQDKANEINKKSLMIFVVD